MLTAEEALAAVLCLGLDVQRVGDDEWRAGCPRCEADLLPLRILRRPDGGVAGGCRWCGRSALVRLVGVDGTPDPALIERQRQLIAQRVAMLVGTVGVMA